MQDDHVKNNNAPRVLISHQGCVPVYRKALFEKLGRVQDIDYVVAYGDPPRGADYMTANPPFGFSSLRVENREIGLGGKLVIWQPLVRRFWRDFDAAILGDEVKFLSNTAIILTAKALRRPVIMWGFGFRPDYPEELAAGPLGRLATWLGKLWRGLLVRSVDGHLAYTESGARYLAGLGVAPERIETVYNTVDVVHQRALAAETAAEPESESRRALGLPDDAPTLVYFGRFLASKHVDLLIDYVIRANAARQCGDGRPVVRAIIIGGGAEEANLRARAARSDAIHFCARDDRTLSRALRVSRAVVIPGYVGLAVTHAFAHGAPLITRVGEHPPEIDYLRPGQNGLMLLTDREAFFAGLDGFLADEALQERLARGACETAAKMTVDTMADAFNSLVRRLLSKRVGAVQRGAEENPYECARR